MTLQEQPRRKEILDYNQGFWPLAAVFPGFPVTGWYFGRSGHLKVQTCSEDSAQHTKQLLTVSQKLILHIKVLLLTNEDLVHVAGRLM